MENTENTWQLSPRAKKILWIIIVVLLVALLCLVGWYVVHYRNYNVYRTLTQSPQTITEGGDFANLKDDLKAVPGFSLAAENDRVALYVKTDTAEVAVYDKENGIAVYSNPQDTDKDPVARATNLENLKSQFILSYLDANAKEGTAWSSYAKAVANGQMEYQSIPDGIRVVYNLSNEKILMVPNQLTAEWYAILAEAGKKAAPKIYEFDEESGLYTMKTQGVTGRNKQQMDQDARNAGFTMEDYEEMQALRVLEDDADAAEALSFTITLDWQLTNDGVRVSIPYEGLGEFGGGQIRAIQLLPFFGAAGTQETGEIVIPDGSGALMRFNNGKSTSPQYSKSVYDIDLVDSDYAVTQNMQTIRLALYGICREESSILAVCERGASLANITADVAGRNNSYNFAYFTFVLRRTDTLMISNETVIVAERDLYPVDCSVRFTLLGSNETGYNGLARAARQQLIDQGLLKKATPVAGDIPFYYDVIGGVKETAHWLGVQYLRVLPMTTFTEAENIVASLKHENISNQKMNLQGWINGGYYHDPVSSVSVLRKLGGTKGLSSLQNALARTGGALYPDAALQFVTDIAKGFFASEEASRYYAEGYVVNLGVINPINLRRTGTLGYRERGFKLLSPKFLPRYAEGLAEAADKLQLNNLSLRDLGQEVHADKRRTNVIDRESALDLVKNAFVTLQGNGRGLMVTGGNDYAITYAADVLDAPLEATIYPILDEQIPLWEMIVRGSADYTGTAINLTQSEDPREDLLHLIEYGASVHYTFTWKDAAEMKYTGLNGLFATTFSTWKDEAVEAYHFVNGALRAVNGAEITEHVRLNETLSRVAYSNGVTLYINHSDADAQADGYTVGAMNYLVVGGEAQ